MVADVEPESRLLLETPEPAAPAEESGHPAEYLPLFVAPTPVPALPAGAADGDDSEPDDDAGG